MNEEIKRMTTLICDLDVSAETKDKLYSQNYKIEGELARLEKTVFNQEKRNSNQRMANSDMQEALEKANKQTSKYAKRCLNALNYIKSREAILGDKRLMNILLGVEEDV